jgi:plastocyanin
LTRTASWRRTTRLAIAGGATALLILSVACGGSDDDEDVDDDGQTAAATTPADDGGGGDGKPLTVDMIMGDNLFDPKELTVPAGASVTINLTNEGAAIHNLRIAGEDGEYNTDDDGVSDPDLVSGGGEAVAEWTAPDQPGEIPFLCDFHPTDMVGTITVE